MKPTRKARVLIRITNTPRDYAWGSLTAIADLLGSVPSGGPEAELWLGSHPGSPARILAGADECDLAQWASAHHPEGRLPFLLKVLAAAAPLSLQAHPTTQQAQEGFAREDSMGVPRDGAERNYRDPYAKPELIVALSDPFEALCGFRPVADAAADLAELGEPRLQPLLDRLRSDDDLPAVVRWLLASGDGAAEVIAALTDRAERFDAPQSWLRTVLSLARAYPGDPGIAISVLMHTIALRPGEALYLPAGNLHAYLGGLGLELMGPSDNVLRGGLTAKHVDVDELLHVLDARPLPTPLLRSDAPLPGARVYAPGGTDLALALLDSRALASGVEVVFSDSAIALVLDGAPTASTGEENATLRRGDAVLITGGRLSVWGEGRTCVASARLRVAATAS